jgi:hypothetical protein
MCVHYVEAIMPKIPVHSVYSTVKWHIAGHISLLFGDFLCFREAYTLTHISYFRQESAEFKENCNESETYFRHNTLSLK